MSVQKNTSMVDSAIHAMAQVYDWKRRHIRELVVGVSVLVISIFSFMGYRWYSVQQDKKAQLVFSRAVEAYNKAVQLDSKDEWEAASMLLRLGYDQYPHSSFAPYFQSFYADALLKQDKRDEALAAMEKAVSLIPSDSPLAPALRIKHALMLLDAHDDAQKNRGEQLLTALANDSSNILADQALFYLGYYCWSNNRLADAKDAWKKLEALFPVTASRQDSPWLARAQEKLAQLAE